MAWFYGTYCCGHEGRTDIVGPTKDRERKADWHFSGLCPECYKKHLIEEKERKNKEAAEKSAEMELPELTGTEKQIAWANTIRLKQINDVNSKIDKLGKLLKEKGLQVIPEENITIKEVLDSFEYFIKTHTESKYWIEHRDTEINLKHMIKEYKSYMETITNKEIIEEIKKEETSFTVSSECEEKKSGVVKIKYHNSIISADYIKDDTFREIVKDLKFSWKDCSWQRKITEFTGTADDRMAELGNRLLLNGFTVCFQSEKSKDIAVAGNFEPEVDRWILRGDDGNLWIKWYKRNDILYQEAKKLPSAKWKDGKIVVSVEFYKEIEDFAETLHFSFSQKAKEEMNKYINQKNHFKLEHVQTPDSKIIDDAKRIKKALKSKGTIIEDLVEEE